MPPGSAHLGSLDGSGGSLASPPLTFCAPSGSRDILLLPLQLPRAIQQAATHKELEAISHLGIGKGPPPSRPPA